MTWEIGIFFRARTGFCPSAPPSPEPCSVLMIIMDPWAMGWVSEKPSSGGARTTWRAVTENIPGSGFTV